jgi:hypothetical protein
MSFRFGEKPARYVEARRFKVQFVYLILVHHRRSIVHLNVTAHLTAQWTGWQILAASGALGVGNVSTSEYLLWQLWLLMSTAL